MNSLIVHDKKTNHLIRTSRKHYVQLRAQWLEKSIVEYMTDVEQLLGNEARIISYYIREEQWVEQIIKATKQDLLMNHVQVFIEQSQSNSI